MQHHADNEPGMKLTLNWKQYALTVLITKDIHLIEKSLQIQLYPV